MVIQLNGHNNLRTIGKHYQNHVVSSLVCLLIVKLLLTQSTPVPSPNKHYQVRRTDFRLGEEVDAKAAIV
jgi:hypothetical protein